MSFGYEWNPAPPKLPKGGLAEVTEALLPMLLWRAPVTKLVVHGLSVLERFTIEAALELDDIAADDVEELTGLPRDVATRVIAHLSAVGILSPASIEGPTYRPVAEAATDALSSSELREYHPATLTFLYLPTTEELIAFEPVPGRPGPPMVHRVTPIYEAPMMPSELVGAPSAQFLADRIASETVLDLPDWVHDVEPDSTRLPETCPAYRCRGHVKTEKNRPASVLTLVDARSASKTVECQLPRAAALTARLVAQSESLTAALRDWGQPETAPIRISSNGPVVWQFPLTGEAARLMINSMPLSRALGLTIIDEEARVTVVAKLDPVDEEARRLFALDEAVRHLLAVPVQDLSPADVDTALEHTKARFELELPADDVRSELWRRKHFATVYALREIDDFPYD